MSNGSGRFMPLTVSAWSEAPWLWPGAPWASSHAPVPAAGLSLGKGRCSLKTCSWMPFMLLFSLSLRGHLRARVASAQQHRALSLVCV
jgi:hypothetical protein